MKSHKCLGHGLGCVVAALLLTTLNVLAAAPTVIYVRAAAAGANNGTSWTNAFTSLQSGLAAASAGDEVWVAAGTYKPTSGTDRTISFALVNGVGVYGGFAGTPGTEGQFVRDWTTNVTTLSGDLNGDDVGFTNNSENSYHVVYSVGCDSSAVLDGFTVTGGNANASVAPDPYGGGMYNEGSPTVTNCTFSGNWASDGGAILNMSGSPAVTNCTFTSNAADSHGGGMLINNISGSPAVTNCTFSGNSATDGGAVYNFGSPTVTNCAFSGNSASARGGGMFNTSSALIVANCVFSGNSAVSGGGMANYQCSPAIQSCVFNGNAAAGGGGMENNEGAQHISNCTFTQNTALGGGGGMLNTNSAPTVSNCVFQGNTEQGGGGGGLRNWAASPTVLNCTFSGNHGHSCGGAISNNFNSVLQVQNSTFTGNLTDAIDVSDDGGGGIENWSSSTVLATNCVFRGNGARGGGIGGGLLNHTTASATLTNCTFSGNSASQGGAVCSSDAGSSAAVVNSILWDDTGGEIAGSTTVTYTCVQGGYTGTGNISGDPLLANAAAGDFRLLPGSPCIDTGTTGGSVPATDIRGLPHVGAPDMGAYECQGFTLTITGGNPQSTSINQMFANPLSLSVSSAIGEPVAAGLVTFTPPASGASATLTGTPATILAGGAAQVTATANGTAGGPYAVTASTPGALNTVQFDLTNDRLPPPTVTASASPASGAVQLAVAFTANGSDADGDPLTYSWEPYRTARAARPRRA
ncbi:MAG: hypothetical protein NTW87_06180 [Planctomycetota bacterium]|nr:hypothetical protein [Planctomycetota bacterium]